MTVSASNTSNGPYAGTGSTTAFPFTFDAADGSEVQVLVNSIVQDPSSYTVTLNAGGNGGTVTFTVAPGSGAQVLIALNPSFAQNIALLNAGAFNAEVIEEGFDRSDRRSLYLKGLIERAIRLPLGETMDPLLPAAGRVGKFLGFDDLSGAPELLSYQSLANILAPLISFSYTGIPGPGNDLATHYETPSGNDNTALNAAAITAGANTGILKLGEGTFHVDQLLIPPNCLVVGAGKGLTILQQNAGQPIGTSVTKIGGPRSGIVGCTVVGNIATDTSEFNHGVECNATLTTGNLYDVLIDVAFQDIRGDGVLIGCRPDAYAAGVRLWNVRAYVEGDNAYRNGFSIVGGSQIRVNYGSLSRIGLYTWDIETNSGGGPVEDVQLDGPRASYVSVYGTTATDFVNKIDVGHLVMDPSYQTTSVPPYPVTRTPNVQGADAIIFRSAKYWRCRSLIASNYDGQAIQHIYNGGDLAAQTVEIGPTTLTNICLGETTYHAFIAGAAGITKLHAHELNITTTLSTHIGVLGCRSSVIHGYTITGPASGWKAFNDSGGTIAFRLSQTNGVFSLNSPGIRVYSGTFNGDTFFSFCDDAIATGVAVTAATNANSGNRATFLGGSINGAANSLSIYSGSTVLSKIDATGVHSAVEFDASSKFKGYLYDINGVKVVGTQQAAIANAGGSAGSNPTGTEFNALANAFNDLLAKLRTHGIIAT